MPFYSNLERKSQSDSEGIGIGGEVILTTPYFNLQGYSFLSFTGTTEHLYKYVLVNSGYSLEPVGSIKSFNSAFQSTRHLKINSSGSTIIPLNQFGFSFTPSVYSGIGISKHGGYTYALNTFFSKRLNAFIFSCASMHNIYGSYRDYAILLNGSIYTVARVGISYQDTNSRYFFLRETNGISALFYNISNASCLISSDGVSWISQSLPAALVIGGCAASSSLFMLHASTGVIYTSPNAATGSWTTRSNIGYVGSRLLAFGNDFWAAITATNTIKISSDGISWVSKTIPNEYWGLLYFNEIDSLFYLKPSSANYFYTTSDFNSFTTYYLPSTDSSSLVLSVSGGGLIVGGYNTLDYKCWQTSNISGLPAFEDFCGQLPSLIYVPTGLGTGDYETYYLLYTKSVINNQQAPPLTPVISGSNFFIKITS
jgi:hypothetical protein